MTTALVRSKGRIRPRALGVLSYLGVLCFIPLMASNDEYIRFHAMQGLVLWGVSVGAVVMLFIPGIGMAIFSYLMFAVFVLSMIGIVSVILKRAWKLPFVYWLASKI